MNRCSIYIHEPDDLSHEKRWYSLRLARSPVRGFYRGIQNGSSSAALVDLN